MKYEEYAEKVEELTRFTSRTGYFAGAFMVLSAASVVLLRWEQLYLKELEERAVFFFFFTIILGALIRYFRLDYLLAAAKAWNVPEVMRRIKIITGISIVYSIVLTAGGAHVAAQTGNLAYLGAFLLSALFCLSFNLPSRTQIEQWLAYADFPIFL